jgi:hypothetical protein
MEAVEVEELLEHTGIKGMRWGVRRTNPSNSKSIDVTSDKTGERISVNYDPSKMSFNVATGEMRGSKAEVQAFQKKISDARNKLEKSDADSIDYKTSVAAKSKSPSNLTNHEMQALVTRMDLEQRYKAAVEKENLVPPTKRAKVVKFATDLLRDVGQQEIRRVAKGKASIAVEAALTRAGYGDVADRSTPKKGITGTTKPSPIGKMVTKLAAKARARRNGP